MTELNDKLQPVDSPVATTVAQSGYDFNAQTERDAISAMNIKNFNFNSGSGGTLTLGGTKNGDGLMRLYDAGGTLIFVGDNTGHHYYNASGVESVKVDLTGFHAYGTAGTSAEQIRVDNIGLHAYGTPGTSQELVTLDKNGLHGYLSSGSEVINIGPEGINGYGTAGNTYEFYNSPGGTLYGEIGYNLSSGTPYFSYTAKNGAYFVMGDDNSTIGMVSNGMLLSTTTGLIAMVVDEVGIVGDLTVTGAKSAIVDSSKGSVTLYANESPENWFMDFCENKNKVDPLFLEVTSPPYHYIKCEDGWYQVWGKRKNMEDRRFEVNKKNHKLDRTTK